MSDLKELLGMLNKETVKTLATPAVDALLAAGEDLKRLIDPISDYMVQNKIKRIKAYKDAGFTQDESIVLALDDMVGLREALKAQNKKS